MPSLILFVGDVRADRTGKCSQAVPEQGALR